MLNRSQYRLLLRVSLIVIGVLCAKLVAHAAGWEFFSINPLFSGIIAANVFLMGFLLSGVLTDFKESEKLPGELATSLENLVQDVRGIKAAKPEAAIEPCLRLLIQLSHDIHAWFFKRHDTRELIEHLNELSDHFADMEQWTQAALISRLKQEQGNLRRLLIRIHTIRETSFISSGYLIADIITIFLCLGLILAKIVPFYESMFFTGVIAFLLIFLLQLIRDLDNPFGYYESSSGEDVSLQPIEDLMERLSCLGLENDSFNRIHAQGDTSSLGWRGTLS